MSNVPPAAGRFEFVVMAGARAKQLLKGCTPRSTGPAKLTRLAEKEIREGKVARLTDEG